LEVGSEILKKLQDVINNAKTIDDIFGKDSMVKDLQKALIEKMLKSEMTEHLGYQNHNSIGNNSGNSRNGISKKTLKTSHGEIELNIPRDRNGQFEPIIIPKHRRTLGELEDKVISMYGKGMTTRDIQGHIEDIYGIELSPVSISNITDSVLELVKEWQNRPLEKIYPIIFLDAIYFKGRDEGTVKNKAAYSVLAYDMNGQKDFLGIWIGEAESSKFWMSLLTELKNRGVNDILIACVDGLAGFTEAINAVYPKTIIQQCIIHQIRNSLKYIISKDKKVFMTDLKTVYKASTESEALTALDRLEVKWGKKYKVVINSWRNNWVYLAAFFNFTQEIRTIIYTTNAVESLHRQFRKVTKAKTLFPNNEAISKVLFLAFRDISKKWIMPIQNWGIIYASFSLIFADRIEVALKT
jgi:transposase-like protein